MKTQRQCPRMALRLSAMEATRWCRATVGLVFKLKTTLKTSVVPTTPKQISQIDDAADCAGSLDLTCMKCDKRVSVAQHLHNLSPFSLHSMIEVSAEAWHATLYLIMLCQWLGPPVISEHQRQFRAGKRGAGRHGRWQRSAVCRPCEGGAGTA